MTQGALPFHRLAVVVPVLNDWDCLALLLPEIGRIGSRTLAVTVFVVDDGSLAGPDPTVIASSCDGLESVSVITLHANMGHQRAICIGLAEALARGAFDAIVVMDSDGEDRPGDIAQLLGTLFATDAQVVVAQRRDRHDGVRFRLFYRLYKGLFTLLTGATLDFGNFSALRSSAAERLVQMPEMWNNYPATVMRSRLPLVRVPLDRGFRYSGRSRMGFVSLVNHGLGAISVFVDVVFVRLLILLTAVFLVAIGVAGCALGVRIVTGTPLPGWLALGTTVAVTGLLMVLATLVLSSFSLLAGRSQPPLPPSAVAAHYVRAVSTVRRAEKTDHHMDAGSSTDTPATANESKPEGTPAS